jgi:hypothetical protein
MATAGSTKDGNQFNRSDKEANFAEKHERACDRLQDWSNRERKKRRFKEKETDDQKISRLRVAELERLLMDRYGSVLPDDDAGREDLKIVFHQLVHINPTTAIERMVGWASGGHHGFPNRKRENSPQTLRVRQKNSQRTVWLSS